MTPPDRDPTAEAAPQEPSATDPWENDPLAGSPLAAVCRGGTDCLCAAWRRAEGALSSAGWLVVSGPNQAGEYVVEANAWHMGFSHPVTEAKFSGSLAVALNALTDEMEAHRG